MPADNFKFDPARSMTPSRAPFAVVPHDTNELPVVPKALRIGTGGILVLRGIDATSDVTIVNVADGETIDISAQFVRASGTTASNIVALA